MKESGPIDDDDGEELLWQLAAEDEEPGEERGEEVVTDSRLRDYREGRLSDEEAAQVEASLLASTAARRRLAERGGVRLDAPPERIRAAVLHLGPRTAHQPSKHRRWWPYAAAAMLALAAGIWSWPGSWNRFGRGETLPRYGLEGRGITAERSATKSGAEHITALPETVLRFVFTPLEAPREGVVIALYREEAGALRQLTAADGLTIEGSRGEFRLSGRAAGLVGREPGSRRLFALVARAGEAPARISFGGDSAERALAGKGRQVLPIVVEVLAEPQRP